MSNNKTIVPGMGSSPVESGFNPAVHQPVQAYKGTMFPGMPKSQILSSSEAHKPIMGFLYSVSRTPNGEFWPLYLGPNSIGRSMTCSVNLSEATVSENHAQIVVREMQNPDGILVFIQDTQATCGTTLNGSTLGFNPVECHNGDIIKVGEHYEFYLMLIDVKTIGLAPSPDFVPVDKPATTAAFPAPSQNPGQFGPFGQQRQQMPQQTRADSTISNNGGTMIIGPGQSF